MVDAYSSEIFLYETVCTMIGKDMHAAHTRKLRQRVSMHFFAMDAR
jgi:hypothetical protein